MLHCQAMRTWENGMNEGQRGEQETFYMVRSLDFIPSLRETTGGFHQQNNNLRQDFKGSLQSL